MTRFMLAAAIALLLASCDRSETPQAAQPPVAPDASVVAPPATAAETDPSAPTPAAATKPAFADKVWTVKESSAVTVGTTYTFLSDGTLVIDAQQGSPGYGQWTYLDGALTMIEEGQAYPTDILRLDDQVFEIRSKHPGGAVTITLVPAPGVAPPPA